MNLDEVNILDAESPR